MKKKSYKFNKFNIFFNDYIKILNKNLIKLNLENLFFASELIFQKIKSKKNIFVCGNGGSAAIADHYVCDFFKQLSKYTNLKANIRSLNSDQYLISAISNDISYSDIFEIQAQRYVKKDDLVILISSSGNSQNIIKLLNFCKKKNIKTIGFTNFSGGYLKKNCNISIHSKINNYGIGEDINHILMHFLMQFIAITNTRKKNNIIL